MPAALFASLLCLSPSLPFWLHPLLPSAVPTPACVFTLAGSGWSPWPLCSLLLVQGGHLGPCVHSSRFRLVTLAPVFTLAGSGWSPWPLCSLLLVQGGHLGPCVHSSRIRGPRGLSCVCVCPSFFASFWKEAPFPPPVLPAPAMHVLEMLSIFSCAGWPFARLLWR